VSIEFSKVGPISFISHLDLQKIVARIFKRAEIEVLYSEGYKTRPLIAFGPALTLGVSSLSEYFDVRVPEAWESNDKLLALLQSHSEKGIIFKSVETIGSKTISIQDSAEKFTYYLQTKNSEESEKAIDFLNAQSELLIDSFSKKAQKYIKKDIRPKILTAYKGKLDLDSQLMDLIDEVSPCKGEGIFVETNVDQGSSVRPSELVKVLAGIGINVERPIKERITLKEFQ
jgi:radical SAM-linked protein